MGLFADSGGDEIFGRTPPLDAGRPDKGRIEDAEFEADTELLVDFEALPVPAPVPVEEEVGREGIFVLTTIISSESSF